MHRGIHLTTNKTPRTTSTPSSTRRNHQQQQQRCTPQPPLVRRKRIGRPRPRRPPLLPLQFIQPAPPPPPRRSRLPNPTPIREILTIQPIFLRRRRLRPPLELHLSLRGAINATEPRIDGGRLFPSPAEAVGVVVDDKDHPDADLAVGADERRAVDPAVAAVFVDARHPAHFGGDAAALGEGVGEFVADAGGAADFVHEGRLEDAGDAEGGGGEEDAEGGVGADEEVLEEVSGFSGGGVLGIRTCW